MNNQEESKVLEEQNAAGTNPEKIEVVEHVESKFDDLQPRTEMSTITPEEKQEILQANPTPEQKSETSNMQEQPVNKKKSSATPVLIVLLVIFGGIIGFFWVMWPSIQASINNQWVKPVIYIYPEEDMDVEVTVSNPEKLTVTYPKYNDGWKVKALTDGTLIDKNNKKYYALYWDGEGDDSTIKSDGFIVKREDAEKFLEEKLEILGLNEREANEFIMYWLPKLENNKKSLVYFELTDEKEKYNKINIDPKPDSLLRLTIHIKKVNKENKIKEQKIKPFVRNGFTVVEWGGVEY